MMRKISKSELKPETPIHVLLKFLQQEINDTCPREKMEDFELGKKVGELKLVDLIKGIVGKYND